MSNFDPSKFLEFDTILHNTCAEFSIPKDLVKAIIWQESRANPWACRYEPQLTLSYMPMQFAQKLHVSVETELFFQRTSWGLMQPLGVIAREMGYPQELPKLCMPEVGIYWGVKKLSLIAQKYKQVDEIISAYNYGSVKTLQGKFANQSYVDSVKDHLFMIRKLEKSG